MRFLKRIVAVVSFLVVSQLSAHPPLTDSIDNLTHRIEHNPGNPELYLRRGELYRTSHNWDAALADYNRAAGIDQKLAAVDMCVGRLHLDRNLPGKALRALDRFIERSPGDPAGLELRGHALAVLGRHSEAEKDFAAAIDGIVSAGGNPRPAAYLNWAEAAKKSGRPTSELLAYIEAALEHLGRPITLELAALRIESDAGLLDDALRRVERLLAIARRPETWLARRAQLLERACRLVEARAAHLAVIQAVDNLPLSRRGVPALARLRSEADASRERLRTAQQVER